MHDLRILPYMSSTDRSLFKNLVFLGKFESIAPDVDDANYLANSNIKSYVDSIFAAPDNANLDTAIIEKTLVGFSITMHIANADIRITHFAIDFFERLQGDGCGYFRVDNPKKVLPLTLVQVPACAFKYEMRKRVSSDENLEKNDRHFIKLFSHVAVNCQAYAADAAETKRLS